MTDIAIIVFLYQSPTMILRFLNNLFQCAKYTMVITAAYLLKNFTPWNKTKVAELQSRAKTVSLKKVHLSSGVTNSYRENLLIRQDYFHL